MRHRLLFFLVDFSDVSVGTVCAGLFARVSGDAHVVVIVVLLNLGKAEIGAGELAYRARQPLSGASTVKPATTWAPRGTA